jgi:hypothetical protein
MQFILTLHNNPTSHRHTFYFNILKETTHQYITGCSIEAEWGQERGTHFPSSVEIRSILLFFNPSPSSACLFFLHRLNACQLNFIVKHVLRDLCAGICNAAPSVIPKTQSYTQKLHAFIVTVIIQPVMKVTGFAS